MEQQISNQNNVNSRSNESIKNVSEKFLDVIFQSLQRLELHERYMKNGCIDLMEYIRIFHHPEGTINYVRVKNLKLMIHEFDILLNNTHSILSDDDHKDLQNKLKTIKKIINEGITKKDKDNKTKETLLVFKESFDNISKQKTMTLNPLFNIIQTELCSLRGLFVKSLNHILYSQTKNKKPDKQTY